MIENYIEDIRKGLNPLVFVKISKSGIDYTQDNDGDIDTVEKITISDLFDSTKKNIKFSEIIDRAQEKASLLPKKTSVKQLDKYIIGDLPGHPGKHVSIAETEEYLELNNIFSLKVENNQESMADTFRFSIPLSSMYFDSKNASKIFTYIKKLVSTLQTKEEIDSRSINQQYTHLNKMKSSGRYVEIYYGYKEQIPDGEEVHDVYDQHFSRFVGCVDFCSVNEIYNIISFSGRDLVGLMMDIKSSVDFSQSLKNVSSVVRTSVMKNTGLVLLENTYTDCMIKGTKKERVKDSILTTQGQITSFLKSVSTTGERYEEETGNIFEIAEKVFDPEKAGDSNQKEINRYAQAAKAFHNSYGNEAINFWDILQFAATITNHVVYLIPGTNIIYFGIPDYSLSKGSINLPSRDTNTGAISNGKEVNTLQFRYSMPVSKHSKKILVATSSSNAGGYYSYVICPKEILGTGGTVSSFVSDLKAKLNAFAAKDSNVNKSSLATDLMYRVKTKDGFQDYSIIFAATGSNFGDAKDLFRFSSIVAYKRLLVDTVKINAMVIGDGTINTSYASTIKNASILERIFNYNDTTLVNDTEYNGVKFKVAEATHEYTSEKGFFTNLLLEKSFLEDMRSTSTGLDNGIYCIELQLDQETVAGLSQDKGSRIYN